MNNLNAEQKELISYLLSEDKMCTISMLDNEEYYDVEEKQDLEERLALIESIIDIT